MTIIVFLIDTSASMNQRTYIGARPTLLDIAKGAVESFVKLRQRNPESRFDRYMLFTSEEPPNNIKAGWKENLATFMNELKNIKATGLSTVGSAIKSIFDVLNINRMQSGIDTYGSGRSPFFLEPSVIICISDGGKLSSSQGVQDDIFPFPKSNPIPGADLTSEIFRWDQRLFGLILRLTGTPTPETMGLVPSDNSPIDELCEQTGGRTYAVRTHRMFQQCIESLVQKVLSGVVINFEKIGPDPPPVTDGKESFDMMEIDKEGSNAASEPLMNMMGSNSNGNSGGILGMSSPGPWPGASVNPSSPAANPQNGSNGSGSNGGTNGSVSWHSSRKMIYVPRPNNRANHGCFWPIPESYWPDSSILSLPARSAHPNLKFTCTSQEPMVIDNLPFDKYELEPSPLTQYILSRKQPNICWQVFVPNSSKNSDVGHPFGYLKASTTKLCVNLFVMPYNYPVLLPLLDDLFKIHRLKPNKEWRQQFDNYLRTMPPYYASPLKRALERMGVSNVFPDKFDSSLSYIVMNQLKKLKNQAKSEYEKICGEVEKRVSQNMNPALSLFSGMNPSASGGGATHEGIKVKSRRHLSRHLTSNHLLKEKFSNLRDQVTDYKNFSIGSVPDAEIQPQMYRNPFDIDRLQLIDQVARMRANFLQQSLSGLLTDKDQDQLHCKPISQMGNYQDYLKKMNPPLREIESTPVRQHMFGNPFKIDKRMSMMVDEADVDLMGGAGRGNKRTVVVDPLMGGSKHPGSKRRKGPVPADFTLQHLVNSNPSSPSSASEDLEWAPMSPVSPPGPPPPITAPGYPVPPSPLYNPQDTPPSSPVPRPDSPIPGAPSLPGTLAPSPVTPGYLQAVSPPGSPAPSPYPRDEDPVSNVPLVNGDVDEFSSTGKMSRLADDSDSDDNDGNLVMDERFDEPSNPTNTLEPQIVPPGGPNERNGISGLNAAPLQRRSSTGANVDSRRFSNPEPVPEQNPMEVDSSQTIQYNKSLLLVCYREVKRPGREFSGLFDKLQTIQGSSETRVKFLKNLMHEALRFKRHSLAGLLTQCVEELQNGGSLSLPPNHIRRINNVPRPVIINGHGR